MGGARLKALLEDSISVLEHMKPYYSHVNVSSAVIVGDTHGFPSVSREAIKLCDEYSADVLVFMGDYVDRGPSGVENLEVILEVFNASPDRVFILRGNHESLYMNRDYGFYEEVLSKVGSQVLEYLNKFYNLLPYTAVINNYFLVHGGIPCIKCTHYFEPALKLDRIYSAVENVRGKDPLVGSDEDSLIAMQLLWNDPNGDIDWFSPSIRGHGIYYYGKKAWNLFLEFNGLKGIIRAHEVVDGLALVDPSGRARSDFTNGSTISHREAKGSVITVFSSKYHGMGAGILYMWEEGFKIHII